MSKNYGEFFSEQIDFYLDREGLESCEVARILVMSEEGVEEYNRLREKTTAYFERGLTPGEIARALDVSEEQVNYWINGRGRRVLRLLNDGWPLRRVAKVFRISEEAVERYKEFRAEMLSRHQKVAG